MPRQPHHSSNWGGRRANQGRPKGAINKMTERAIEMADRCKIHPLQYLLSVVEDESADRKDRMTAASAALPYCQSKLSVAEINVNSPIDNMTQDQKLAMATALVGRIIEHAPEMAGLLPADLKEIQEHVG